MFVSVSDAVRRATLIRALRSTVEVRLAATADEADVVLIDASPRLDRTLGTPSARRGASVASRSRQSAGGAIGQDLTAREQEVLQLLAAGLGNANLGRQLGISTSTVKYHLAAVFTKLGVRTRAEAVAEGVRRGVVLL